MSTPDYTWRCDADYCDEDTTVRHVRESGVYCQYHSQFLIVNSDDRTAEVRRQTDAIDTARRTVPQTVPQTSPATFYVFPHRCAFGCFDSLVDARNVANEIELDTGKRVAIDAIHPDGRTERVYGPPRDDD